MIGKEHEMKLRNRLAALGSDVLADALIGLAMKSKDAVLAVRFLVGTEEERFQYLKDEIAALKKQTRRIFEGEAARDAEENLRRILHQIVQGIMDPESGLELMFRFCQLEPRFIRRFYGDIEGLRQLFGEEADDVIAGYLWRHPDPLKWVPHLWKFLHKDDISFRAGVFLDLRPVMNREMERHLVFYLQRQIVVAGKKLDTDIQMTLELKLLDLAMVFRDADLYVEAWNAHYGELDAFAACDLARIHLMNGDPERAMEVVESIADMEGADDCLALPQVRQEVIEILNTSEDAVAIAWHMFRQERSRDNFERLLNLVGDEKLPKIVAEETDLILSSMQLDMSNAIFLFENMKWRECERYLVTRCGQIANVPEHLVEYMALRMKHAHLNLGYAALGRSILERCLASGRPGMVLRALNLLLDLENMAKNTGEWGALSPHRQYVEDLENKFAHMREFWNVWREPRA